MHPFTTSLEEGVYRICNGSGPNLWLTMDPPDPTTGKSAVSVRPDNPSARNQQWKIVLYPESNSYSFFSLGQSLYLGVDPNSWVSQGGLKPLAFRLRLGIDQEQFNILYFPTDYFVGCDGSRATYSLSGSEAVSKWKFRKVSRSARIPKALPLVGVPPVFEGTYRIVNGHSRLYLTMLDTPESGQKYPYAVGRTYGSDLTAQQWKVTRHNLTQTYFLKNVGTGRWLSIQEDGKINSPPFFFTGVDEEIGAVHWDLRQAETDGEFYIQHYAGLTFSVAAAQLGKENGDSMVLLQKRMKVSNPSTTISWDTWSFEPAEEDMDPTALQDLPYGGSLKTGTYKIRNVETRALLTQDETFPPSPPKPHCSSPLLNCSKEVSGERGKFQQWNVLFIKEAQQYFFQSVYSGRFISTLRHFSKDFVASNQVFPWVVLQGEEMGEFILYASGSDQVVSVSGEPQAGTLSLTTRLYQLQTNWGRQRWIFEPVDPEGSDLEDPNTPNYPSSFSRLNIKPSDSGNDRSSGRD